MYTIADVLPAHGHLGACCAACASGQKTCAGLGLTTAQGSRLLSAEHFQLLVPESSPPRWLVPVAVAAIVALVWLRKRRRR